MQILEHPGVTLIKKFEGCHLEAYPDPLSGGRPYTIGWGNTKDLDGSPFELGDKITQRQADELLAIKLRDEFVPPLLNIPGWGDMNENQHGALMSFAWNLGANFYNSSGFETITRVLKNKKYEEIEEALLLYVNPGTNVEEGLRRRRQAEADLFNDPYLIGFC